MTDVNRRGPGTTSMTDTATDSGGPYPLQEPGASLGELVSRLTGEMGDLVATHLELAKTEIKQEVAKSGKGAGLLGAGGLAGWLAAVMLSFAAAWGLAEPFANIWLGFLVVGLAWALVAAVLAMVGRDRLREVSGPEETQRELERDKAWLKEQTN